MSLTTTKLSTGPNSETAAGNLNGRPFPLVCLDPFGYSHSNKALGDTRLSQTTPTLTTREPSASEITAGPGCRCASNPSCRSTALSRTRRRRRSSSPNGIPRTHLPDGEVSVILDAGGSEGSGGGPQGLTSSF